MIAISQYTKALPMPDVILIQKSEHSHTHTPTYHSRTGVTATVDHDSEHAHIHTPTILEQGVQLLISADN